MEKPENAYAGTVVIARPAKNYFAVFSRLAFLASANALPTASRFVLSLFAQRPNTKNRIFSFTFSAGKLSAQPPCFVFVFIVQPLYHVVLFRTSIIISKWT